MTKRIYGSLELRTQSSIIFTDLDSSNSLSLKSPATVSSDFSLILPSSILTNGVMVSDSGGNLSLSLLTDSNIDNSAAITLSKLASLTTSRALVSDGSGVISVSSVTSTELGYVSGVTSAIQTQIDSKLNSNDIRVAADWASGDGTTKAVTHNLGSLDIIAQVYDKSDNSTVFVDSIVRTDNNTLTLTSSEAPGVSGWRVLIIKAG